jgi:hypothetical protein
MVAMARTGKFLGAVFLCVFILSLSRSAAAQHQTPTIAANDPNGGPVDYATFKDPPREYWGHAWFTFNLSSLNEDRVRSMVQQAVKSDSYGGFMITSSGGFGGRGFGRAAATGGTPVTYLNEEFFRLYKVAVEEGLKNNLPMDVLYDELQFPTGMAGGLFYAKYPNDVEKSLEKVEKDVTGAAQAELTIPIPNGIYLGTVMMNLETLACVDVSDRTSRDNATLACQVPTGTWKVMVFYLDPARRRGICDYLDAKVVDELIEIMYERYYDHLKDYFGKVIKMSFYDEPSLHNAVSGRLWTPGFNEAFQQKYGYCPMKYYPALWYDIGPETAAARHALYGFRTELYAENFVGRIAAWCEKHGIAMSGHVDQEEPRSPVGTQGDLMEIFKHQQIPGIDDIWFTGRSNVSYKVIATSKLPTRSAEFRQDRQVRQIVGEVFGIPAYGPMTAAIRAFTDDFKTFFAHPHPAGGKAYFLPRPEPKMVDAVLKEALPARDVEIQMPWLWPVPMNRDYAGALTYIHKIKSGRHIYFFANSSDAAVDTTIILRGRRNLALWDPHTGRRKETEVTASETAGQPVTASHLALQPLTSVFYVQE